MFPRRERWIVLVLAASLLAVSAHAAPAGSKASASRAAPDTARARVLLHEMQVRYRSASSYLYEGRIDMYLRMGTREAAYEIPFRLAAMKPARMRTEMMSSGVSVIAVGDGEYFYNYIPTSNQYTRRAASAIAVIGDSVGLAQALANGTPLERPIALSTSLKIARFLPAQTLSVGERNVKCWVVEATYGTVPGTHLSISPTRMWIDPERKLIVRDSVLLVTQGPSGDSLFTRQVTNYHTMVVNEPLPDSLFTFRPPPGATLVEQAQEPVSPLVGKPAQDFSLGDLSGRVRSLAEHKGKVVLLDFWATWCGPCRRELPHIVKLHRELESKGLAVVAVNVAEPEKVVRDFLAKNKYDLPIWMDVDGSVAGRYGASGLPTLVVIDREGSVAAHLIGLRSEAEVRAELKKVGID